MSPRGVLWVRAAGVLAVVLSCLGVVADLALQYTSNAAHLYRIDALIADVPVWRLYLGTELGLVVFVLAGAGVWHVSAGLARSPRLARVFLVSGLLAYAWGAAFHATFLYRGLLDHAADYGAQVTDASRLRDAFQVGEVGALAPAALMLVVASVCYAWAVLRGRSAYPRWAVVFTPALVYAVLTAAAMTVPVVDLVLAPAVFSLTSLILFGASTVLLWRQPAGPLTRRGER